MTQPTDSPGQPADSIDLHTENAAFGMVCGLDGRVQFFSVIPKLEAARAMREFAAGLENGAGDTRLVDGGRL